MGWAARSAVTAAFPGFGGDAPAAPAGFGLPGTPPAVEAAEPGDGPDQDKPASGDNRGGVGFVNPGNPAGEPGQNPG